jgi:4-hydroxy-tetrahydrodipicolinate synthase
MLTPLHSDGEIDHALFAAHAQNLLQAGCGGVTPFGTTGEGTSFDVSERMAAVDALVSGGVAAERMIVSVSSASVKEVLKATLHAQSLGMHGVLMLPPFYFKGVSEEGILNSYRYVLDRALKQPGGSKLRMYVYHLPQVCAVPLTHSVIAKLLEEYPGVIAGIKDSECSTAHSVALAERFAQDISVYVGNELDLRTMARLGTQGAISGLANFWPELVHSLVTQPDGANAQAQHDQVKTLLEIFSGYSLIPAIKAAMAWKANNEAWLRVRAPLVALSSAQVQTLRAQLTAAQISLAAA